MPTLNLIAGQPLRIHVGVSKGDDKDDIISGLGMGAHTHVKTTQVSCESSHTATVRRAGDQ